MPSGSLLASGAYFFIFPHHGWRPLFVIGGAPAILALFIRFRVKESEVWKKSPNPKAGRIWAMRHRFALAAVPRPHAADVDDEPGVARNPGHVPNVARKTKWHFGRFKGKLPASTPSAWSAPSSAAWLVGLASDKIGRRRAMVLSFVVRDPVDPAMGLRARACGLLIVGAFTIQFFVQGAWGVIPAHLTELVARFGARVSARISPTSAACCHGRQHQLRAGGPQAAHELCRTRWP